MQYEAITSVRCGKTYRAGQLIPDGVLSDRDIKIMLELGSIKALSEFGIAEQSALSQEEDATGEHKEASTPLSGVITSGGAILDYVNSADEAGLGKIKGVGKTTAKAMASHGAFASIDELKALVPNVNWDSIQIV